MSHLRPDELAYYAAKPWGLVLLTAVATFGAVAASILLLARRSGAVWMFAASLAAIAVSNAVELVTGASRATANGGAAMATVFIVLIAVGLLIYAWTMARRGVLR